MVINWPETPMWPEFQDAKRLHRRAAEVEALGDHERAAHLRARADELLDHRTPEVPVMDEPTPRQAALAALTVIGGFIAVVAVGVLMVVAAHL